MKKIQLKRLYICTVLLKLISFIFMNVSRLLDDNLSLLREVQKVLSLFDVFCLRNNTIMQCIIFIKCYSQNQKYNTCMTYNYGC